jgi:HemY protein
MRWLTWALVLSLLAAAVAMVLQVNAGNVAFLVTPYRLDVSLNLFLLLLTGVLLLAYWGGRALQRMIDFPEQVRLYRARREEVGGQQALVEAVRSLLEGRFARAEKAARAAQSSSSTAGVAALIGARAAHRMQEYGRRDDWLTRAEDSREVDTARLVASAEMWSEQRENDAALGAIDRLQGAGARHIHAMRIALNANLQSGRWDEALKAMRALEKRNALHPVLARKLKLAAYRELLLAQRDPASLEEAWKAIPAADRALRGGAGGGATAQRRRTRRPRGRCDRAGAEMPRSEWDETCEWLLDEYARAQSFPARDQLERVERWLAESPREDSIRAVLLRTAGVLCLREQLWGKSGSYLNESLQISKQPATLVALARLAEAVGDEAEAARHYREAALGFVQPASTGADSTRPVLREHTV